MNKKRDDRTWELHDDDGTSAVSSVSQDGFALGIFTNGVTRELARIAVANFNNRGGTISNTLELSNVDITEQFTNMIITQRGYQANSRIITTTDEVIQEALNLKR